MTICKTCFNLIEKYLPLIEEKDRGELLMSATCYPCGSHDIVEQQILELAEKTDGTLFGCLRFAEEELDRQMEELRSRNLLCYAEIS